MAHLVFGQEALEDQVVLRRVDGHHRVFPIGNACTMVLFGKDRARPAVDV
jgi:hypothetical protein